MAMKMVMKMVDFSAAKMVSFLTTTGELTDRNWDVTEKWWI
jgi:hypothetical protein